MNATKKAFATHLKAGLLKHYQGRMPSFNAIARDFTLRAPELPPVSSETVRHWLRGESLPHVSRMQVLTDWLGAELTDFALQRHTDCCNKGLNKNCPNDRVMLCDMIEKLDQQESQTMIAILNMLAVRHDAASH
jgi:hypothetical protein